MRRSLPALLLVALAACSRPEAPMPAARRPPGTLVPGRFQSGDVSLSLPKAVGPWERPDAARRVTAEKIFDYMDGGGELYLAYRFDRLDVCEYKAADSSLGTILVELYWMKTPDDAFGLLSNDWGGEAPGWDAGPARLAGAQPRGERPTSAVYELPTLWPHAALYGAGLLRLWTGELYVRILASREGGESRQAVLALGKEIAGSGALPAIPRQPTAVPGFLAALVPPAGARQLRPDRTCFFRSHLVLNSAYFLATSDILGLGLDVDAVTTEYRPSAPGERPTRVILARYPSAARARAGLTTFVAAYLPDAAPKGPLAAAGAARVEHGWVGWATKAQDLVIALDAPAAAVAREMATAIVGATPPPGSGDK